MIVAFCLAALVSAAPGNDVELWMFTSAHCPACRTLEPAISRIADDGVLVKHLDFEANEQLAARYNVSRLPTLVLVRNGQEIDRAIGAMSYDRLSGWLAEKGGNATAASQGPTSKNQPAQPRQDLFADVATWSKQQDAGHTLVPTSLRENALPAGQPTQSNLAPEQLAFAATVRLKVDEGKSTGYGTGTVIDCHGEEYLILTCGHLFRDNQGKGTIVVDMFAPGQPQGIKARLIDHDLTRDVALVSFKPGVKLTPAPVAGPDYRPQIGEPVFTVGCDKGATPSVLASQLTSIDKYQGHPNVTVKGAPVDGRSGGGLFTADGRLIGVCNAADHKDNEGLYASLPAVHWQLDRIGQQRIYQGSRETAVVATTNVNTVAPIPTQPLNPPSHLNGLGNIPSLPNDMPPATFNPNPIVTTAATAPLNQVQPTPATPAAPLESDFEVLCVVRSKAQPHLPPQVFTLQQLPLEVQQQISAAQSAAANNSRVATNPGPVIIRGQR